jgi:hypothetical protein
MRTRIQTKGQRVGDAPRIHQMQCVLKVATEFHGIAAIVIIKRPDRLT